MQIIALGIVFLLELIAFYGVATIGFLLPVEWPIQVIAAVGLCIVAVAFWGIFMAPKSPRKFTGSKYYVVKTIFYILAAPGLGYFYGFAFAATFIIVAAIDEPLAARHNLG